MPDAILSAGTNFGDGDNACELHALTTLLGPRAIPQKPNYPICFCVPPLVVMSIPWLTGLDSPTSCYEPPTSNSNTRLTLHHLSTVLNSLANSAETSVETNLGLVESALIALDIIQIAQVYKANQYVKSTRTDSMSHSMQKATGSYARISQIRPTNF